MMYEITYSEIMGNLHIEVRFCDNKVLECFMSQDELIVRTVSRVILNVPQNSVYWKDVIDKVKWCEDNFEAMRDLYYGD